jgi:hypothetical protein
MDRGPDSLVVGLGASLRQNVSTTPFMVPPLPLEHLEHGNVFLVERVALDYLEMHGLKPSLAGDRNLFWGETILDLTHMRNIAIWLEKSRISNLLETPGARFTSLARPRDNNKETRGEDRNARQSGR